MRRHLCSAAFAPVPPIEDGELQARRGRFHEPDRHTIPLLLYEKKYGCFVIWITHSRCQVETGAFRILYPQFRILYKGHSALHVSTDRSTIF